MYCKDHGNQDPDNRGLTVGIFENGKVCKCIRKFAIGLYLCEEEDQTTFTYVVEHLLQRHF